MGFPPIQHPMVRTSYPPPPSNQKASADERPLSRDLEPLLTFHYEASEAIRGSVMHLIRLVFSHLAGSYLLYWHNCGVVTNSRQPTPTWPGFPAILQRRSGRNQLPGSYRTTQSGLTHSVHSRQIPQEWMDQLLEHCKGLDQQQGFAVLLTLLKALNSIPGRSSSMQV